MYSLKQSDIIKVTSLLAKISGTVPAFFAKSTIMLLSLALKNVTSLLSLQRTVQEGRSFAFHERDRPCQVPMVYNNLKNAYGFGNRIIYRCKGKQKASLIVGRGKSKL